MPELPRRDRIGETTLSALRAADGQAWVFLLRILGRAVADRVWADCLYFLHRVFVIEPDAVKWRGNFLSVSFKNVRVWLSVASGHNTIGESALRRHCSIYVVLLKFLK